MPSSKGGGGGDVGGKMSKSLQKRDYIASEKKFRCIYLSRKSKIMNERERYYVCMCDIYFVLCFKKLKKFNVLLLNVCYF